MKIVVKRLHFTDKSTISELSIDGTFECYVLEDVEREIKIQGKTAIPKGTYKIGFRYSPHFKKIVPWLLNVPNYLFILIHWGNTALDTEGCLLVGKTRSLDFVGESKKAFQSLFAKLQDAKDEITITIE